MKKLVLFINITIFDWIGGWPGAHMGVMTACMISVIGSFLGVYVGVRMEPGNCKAGNIYSFNSTRFI